jgi:UPF0042 nucleotide-binding protein
MKNLSLSVPAGGQRMDDDSRTRQRKTARVVVVTGMSGAGKTSVLKTLQDLGYETVDHVPLSLLGRLVMPAEPNGSGPKGPVAVGIDIRTRDFGIEAFFEQVDRLAAETEAEVQLMFLDCDDDELRRRYTVTRHRHPLAIDRPLTDGIALERRTIFPLRARADIVIDTSQLSLGELKRIVGEQFALRTEPGLAIFVTSFSFRLGLPREADLVFDVRFLANPYYESALRPLTGRDPEIAAFIRKDDGWPPFLDALTGLMRPLLPRYAAEGKSYLTIAVGCTGGRHRSVFVAEQLVAWLRGLDLRVHLHHRDVDRSG